MIISYRQPFKGEYPITQGYGDTATSSFHTGIDYGCPTGTPILASADGIVYFAGWDRYGYGNCVIILHPDYQATLYAHLEKVLVREQEKVKQGQIIGLSDSTGNSTGPHLHFEARKYWNLPSSHFNPMNLPMMSVDDTIPDTEPVIPTPTPEPTHPKVDGISEVVCSVAWVRDWQNIQRSYTVNKGTQVYVFPEKKIYDGLPFRYIGANRCMAEYDGEGTQILKGVEE